MLIYHHLILVYLQTLKMSFIESETGDEYLLQDDDEDQQETIFIMQEFEGDAYSRLQRSGARILGPTVLCKSATNSEVLCIIIKEQNPDCL